MARPKSVDEYGKVVSGRVPAQQQAMLTAIAKQRGVRPGALVREAVLIWLAKQVPENQEQTPNNTIQIVKNPI